MKHLNVIVLHRDRAENLKECFYDMSQQCRIFNF